MKERKKEKKKMQLKKRKKMIKNEDKRKEEKKKREESDKVWTRQDIAKGELFWSEPSLFAKICDRAQPGANFCHQLSPDPPHFILDTIEQLAKYNEIWIQKMGENPQFRSSWALLAQICSATFFSDSALQLVYNGLT